MRSRLFTPGPTQIPEAVRAASAQPFPYHRGPEFKKILQEVFAGLQYFFQTQREVILLTSSGTGGMEACVCNLLNAGDNVLVIEGGKFGERWTELCHAYRLNASSMRLPWGKALDWNTLEKALGNLPNLAAVFCNHSETSTGVFTDVRRVAEMVHNVSDALVIVDGVTSVGVLPFYFDAWNLDACVAGSQKGAMAQPGLAFVALSERAWQRHEVCQNTRYYFDFTKARQAAKENGTAWTPAINAILGLAESLRMIQAHGLEHYWKHYARLARATRAGMQTLGLEIFPESPSNALTAVSVPPNINGKTLTGLLHDKYGVTVAGGQGQLKGKIFRVTHMGDYDHLDTIAMMAAVEMALAELGWKFDWGKGLTAMQREFNQEV